MEALADQFLNLPEGYDSDDRLQAGNAPDQGHLPERIGE